MSFTNIKRGPIKDVPAQDVLQEMFEYTQDGWLVWKRRGNSGRGCFNAIFAGKRAGCPRPSGYRLITLFRKLHFEHRVVYTYHYGEIPKGMDIDHLNGDPSDNRIENLAAKTRSENLRNRRLPSHNTSGFCGVKQTPSGRFSCRATVDYEESHIGTFDTAEEAFAAGMAYRQGRGFTNRHGTPANPLPSLQDKDR